MSAVDESNLSNTIENELLTQLKSHDAEIGDSGDWAKGHGWAHDDTLDGVLKSFAALGVVQLATIEHRTLGLTSDGQDIVANGSPEARILDLIPEQGISQKEFDEVAKAKLGPVLPKLGFGEAMKSGWIRSDKQTKQLFKNVAQADDKVRHQLTSLQGLSDAEVSALRRRKLVADTVSKTYKVSRGPEYTPEWKKPVADLTPKMLQTGSWREETFKAYNFDALGAVPQAGHLHPLMKVRAEYRELFLELGFEEMATNRYVESSFWNFDSLFQPQQHPARDAHDTFFLITPATTKTLPEDYVRRVDEMHSKGGHGSIGWRYDWKEEEARKNILRTHTTAISSRMLYKLAQDCAKSGTFTPKKYFSIDRVFRNETLDATHLAEFHQIEGLVADRNLTLGNLIGMISQFYNRLGIHNIRFKPAYNPYTEPSMEIFGFHPQLHKWVELGNSGMFRPEMLLPLGLPEDVRVIAWGLGLERPTMIKYKIPNIRDIFGPKTDLSFIKNNPLALMENSKDVV